MQERVTENVGSRVSHLPDAHDGWSSWETWLAHSWIEATLVRKECAGEVITEQKVREILRNRMIRMYGTNMATPRIRNFLKGMSITEIVNEYGGSDTQNGKSGYI